MEIIECDVLIIGSGGAGLRAAIEAKETFEEGKVLLVSKGIVGKSGVTATACSDRMAFHATLPYTEPGGPDNWKYHAKDIYRIGGYVSDGDLAHILAKEAQQAFEYLDRLGVPFVKKEVQKPLLRRHLRRHLKFLLKLPPKLPPDKIRWNKLS